MTRSTRTFVELEVPSEVYNFVYLKLEEAGYQYALDEKARQ